MDGRMNGGMDEGRRLRDVCVCVCVCMSLVGAL